jgi:hypothetical protein
VTPSCFDSNHLVTEGNVQHHNQRGHGRRLATVNQIPNLAGYDWLTVPALRHLIFNAESRLNSRGETIPGNGLKEVGAIFRIGRKLLIDLDKFDQWIDRHWLASTSASAVDCNQAPGNTADPQLESKLVQAQPLGELPICKPGSAITDEERGDA